MIKKIGIDSEIVIKQTHKLAFFFHSSVFFVFVIRPFPEFEQKRIRQKKPIGKCFEFVEKGK